MRHERILPKLSQPLGILLDALASIVSGFVFLTRRVDRIIPS